MIYEDKKIECEKWRATVTATLDTATIPGTIQTLMTASMVTVFGVAVIIGNALPLSLKKLQLITHPTLPAPPHLLTPPPQVAVMAACH